jgi:hypothetical protein
MPNPHIHYHGRYVGRSRRLRGSTALLRFETDGRFMAKFDDFELFPLCYGWWPFKPSDFKREQLTKVN